jgi:16S rRNA (cytidine1402-2'-O)-methyltransferase
MMNVQKSFNAESSKGTLFLVATPIGNLEDMTFRAVRVLGEVDWIAAEDTRQTRKLLTHFNISSKLVSYHEHNKKTSGAVLLQALLDGQSVALVSDAGMPAISDPGVELVQAAIEYEVAVVPIPGANAALSALIISGLPTERFMFVGFLPREKKALRDALEQLKLQTATLLLYESPHRVLKTLQAIEACWGQRRAAVVRELTKRFEEVARGTIPELVQFVQEYGVKGEYCIIIEGGKEPEAQADNLWWSALTLEEHVDHYTDQLGNRKEAIKQVAVERKLPKREVYNHIHADDLKP